MYNLVQSPLPTVDMYGHKRLCECVTNLRKKHGQNRTGRASALPQQSLPTRQHAQSPWGRRSHVLARQSVRSVRIGRTRRLSVAPSEMRPPRRW